MGISLWLNKGSRIHVTWETHIKDFNEVSLALIKGNNNFVTVQPSDLVTFHDSPVHNNLTNGNGQAEYSIEEDDRYHISVQNKNPGSISLAINATVSSTMYDTSEAETKCSTTNGLCQLKLIFPNSQYLVLATPNDGDINGWVIELTFVTSLITYIAILGFVILVVSLILKCLGACERREVVEEATMAEDGTLTLGKSVQVTYGTNEEDTELGKCSSSEDLYDGKICVICYDEQRNCFFLPCGHSATCYECAQRIMEVENKVCPICRRFIHRVRRLISL